MRKSMIEDVCRECRNWFCIGQLHGKIMIKDGKIYLPWGFIRDGSDDWEWDPFNFEDDILTVRGQYFRIVGSVFNDGVYQNQETTLTDEIFTGAVWAMAIPAAFLELVGDIEAWAEKYNDISSQAMSPFVSESFGGYSYNKGSNGSGSGAGGNIPTWQAAFAGKLAKWRKIR